MRALQEIDQILASPSTSDVRFLLAPTGNIQELSIENGWGNEFLALASDIEIALGLA